MRLKMQDLEDEVSVINTLLMKDYVVGKWNGLYHVYTQSKGQALITGTLRQCYDYCIAYIQGIADDREVYA